MGMKTLLLYEGKDFIAELSNIVIWLVSIAGALMTLYAVYIGYLFATASDESKRKNAKSRLIKIISSVFIVYALAATLGVIKVEFTDIEKSANKEEINTDWSTVEFEYRGYVELKVNVEENERYVTKGFTLYPKEIKIIGSETSLSGLKLENFSFTGKAEDGMSHLGIGECVKNSDGSLTFNYTCRSRVELDDEDVELLVEKKDGGNGWIYGVLAFMDDKGMSYSCLVNVYLIENTVKINMRV